MKLVFLGKLADLAGRGESTLGSSAPLDWPDVRAWIEDMHGEAIADEIASARVKVAVNGKLLGDKQALQVWKDDEIAFLPPVSGG